MYQTVQNNETMALAYKGNQQHVNAFHVDGTILKCCTITAPLVCSFIMTDLLHAFTVILQKGISKKIKILPVLLNNNTCVRQLYIGLSRGAKQLKPLSLFIPL